MTYQSGPAYLNNSVPQGISEKIITMSLHETLLPKWDLLSRCLLRYGGLHNSFFLLNRYVASSLKLQGGKLRELAPRLKGKNLQVPDFLPFLQVLTEDHRNPGSCRISRNKTGAKKGTG